MMMPKRHTRLALCTALLIAALGFTAKAYAAAACLAGMPCIVPATPNDPVNQQDGPSAAGSPNIDKLSEPLGACDADLMNQIYSRAWLESQRETIKARILVRKPDSILEYTCFNQLANVTATKAPPLFSESTRWALQILPLGLINYRPVIAELTVLMPPGMLLGHIGTLVQMSLSQYITDNFSHRFLGGSANLDYTGGLGGTYNCTNMNRVYFEAKCRDAVTDDRFWKFSELINPDPRLLPQICSNGTKITQQQIDLAENKDFLYVTRDPVTFTYNNLLQPPGAGNTCAKPIPTGIVVISSTRTVDLLGNVRIVSTTTFNDAICPNPDCVYNPSGINGGECAPP